MSTSYSDEPLETAVAGDSATPNEMRLEAGLQTAGSLASTTYRWAVSAPLGLGVEAGWGLDALAWGPGYHSHLILSDQARPYPLVFARGTTLGVDWEQFGALLEPSDDRRLIGHRLTKRMGGLTVQVAETGLIQGDAPILMYIPVPIVPLTLRQSLSARTSANINLNADVSATLRLGPVDVYAEYYVDQLSPQPWLQPVPPVATGYVVGLTSAAHTALGPSLGLEYARVEAYTYTHAGTGNYLHEGEPLGFQLGPSSDSLNVDASFRMGPAWTVGVAAAQSRKGEWEPGDAWSAAVERDAGFPAGNPEIATSVLLKAAHESPRFVLKGAIGAERVQNVGHVAGATSSITPTGSLGLTMKFGYDSGPRVAGESGVDGEPAAAFDGPWTLALGSAYTAGMATPEGRLECRGLLFPSSVVSAQANAMLSATEMVALAKVRAGAQLGPVLPYAALGFTAYAKGDPSGASEEDVRAEASAGVELAVPLFGGLRAVLGAEVGVSHSVSYLMAEGWATHPVGVTPTRLVARYEAGVEADLRGFTLRASAVNMPNTDFGWYSVPAWQYRLNLSHQL